MTLSSDDHCPLLFEYSIVAFFRRLFVTERHLEISHHDSFIISKRFCERPLPCETCQMAYLKRRMTSSMKLEDQKVSFALSMKNLCCFSLATLDAKILEIPFPFFVPQNTLESLSCYFGRSFKRMFFRSDVV